MSARRPRALLVTGAYAPEISSGGLQCGMVARVLEPQVDFHVFATALDSTLPAQSIVDGVKVSRVVVRASGANASAALRLIGELARLAKQSDVVHVHGYSRKTAIAVAMARLCRVPAVLSLHTAGFDDPAAIARQGAMARWAMTAVDAWVTVSPALRDSCLAFGIAPQRLHYVPNGVDVNRFRPASVDERRALRRGFGIPEDRAVVLFVGFFSRDKQPHVLADAWLRLQQPGATPTTLLMVGATESPYFEVDPRLAEDIRASARGAGVEDRLILIPPTPNVHDCFRAADLFVLPSAREGLPVTLLEAMACGLPVVASRLPGATDWVVEDGRTGVLVTPGDAAGFADAIQSVLADAARAEAMGRNARLRIEREFSAEQTARGWLAAYRAVSTAFA